MMGRPGDLEIHPGPYLDPIQITKLKHIFLVYIKIICRRVPVPISTKMKR